MAEWMAWLREAVARHAQGALDEAERGYRRVLGVRPDDPDAAHLLGVLLCARGQTEAGLQSLGHALNVRPDFGQAHYNRGNILFGLGRIEAALACYDQAVALLPDFADAHHNRARAQLALGDATAAIGSYTSVLARQPHDAVALGERARALQEIGDMAAALAGYDAALAVQPDLTEAHYNRACLLQETGDAQAALQGYARALALDPSHAPSLWNQAMCRLLAGDFSPWPQGWGGSRRGEAAAPGWDGTAPIGGRRVLVHTAQGLGDTLQFVRFLPKLTARGALVVLEAQPELVRLLATRPELGTVVAQGAKLPPVDRQCALLDLPGLLRLDAAGIASASPYLSADAAWVGVWRARLDALPGRKVGLVWAGASRPDRNSIRTDRRRSLPLAALAPLAGLAGFTFVSLQKGPQARQAAEVPGLIDWTAELGDFADTAGLVAALDLVISVDTSVAHLAGALGVPVWLLNRLDTCWRWQLGRDDSPWYPSLRQFRQTRMGDWDGVVARVRQALQALSPDGFCSTPAP